MIPMLLKMSAVTALYIAVTILLNRWIQNQKKTHALKLLVGLIYGGLSVLSTHFGVDYGHMMLNVRDMGPLSAGLFFFPTSGVIAGLIGGVERYIAGTFWGIGSYTRVACAISTILAGLLPPVIHYLALKRRKPSTLYAFFIGAVMEVFHMYVVFITHRDDMNMAYYVVRTCAPPMILFSALGLTGCSIGIRVQMGLWKNPLRRLPRDEVPLSSRFQFWLFLVTSCLFLVNIFGAYEIQTQVSLQNARETLKASATDIRETYNHIRAAQDSVGTFLKSTVLSDARTVAYGLKSARPETIDSEHLEALREIYQLEALRIVDVEGTELCAAGTAVSRYGATLNTLKDSATELVNGWLAAAAPLNEGYVQAVLDPDDVNMAVNLEALNDSLAYFHVGAEGSFDIVVLPGIIEVGTHQHLTQSPGDIETLRSLPVGEFFEKTLFGSESLCWMERIGPSRTLLLTLPLSEIYESRNIQVYENTFADIILFTIIYMLISVLVQSIVVDNLQAVNHSLGKITHGNLNEVVSVRDSSEFASLSDDINMTVEVLKGYIAAAEQRIEKELEFAAAIQDAALPKNFKFNRTDLELYAMMDPAKEVGGDFYDFFFIRQNIMALVIADVSGKGIPAALFMMRAKTAIRSLAVSGDQPSDIFYKANNTLCEGNDAEMFVTAWIGIIDLTTGLMRCANAGHEYPILLQNGGDYTLYKDRHGLALAAMEDMPFRSYELQLRPGDRIFVYTDGVPEAIDPNEQQYGIQRLIDKLNELKNMKMAQLLPMVRQDISDFVGGAEQFDDITMLGFTYYGTQEGEAST